MKKQNKIYLPLKEQGIKKAWDKVAIFRTKEDTGHNGSLQMVVYWQGKPFAYWSIVKDNFDALTLDNAISCCIKYYNGLDLNARRISKRITKYFLDRSAGNVVKVFKAGV